jgi:hypothetical protein
VNGYGAGNYWVDVLFEPGNSSDTSRPSILSVSPVANATNVDSQGPIVVNFTEAVDASSVGSATISIRAGSTNIVFAVDATADKVTITPASPLEDNTVYTITIRGGSSGITDLAGNTMTADYTWSFRTAPFSGPVYTLFQPTATPAMAATQDGSPIETGVKFRAAKDGYVTGLRFYKGVMSTGTHIAHLWTADGRQLAADTFANETPSGWQQMLFSSPVQVKANTTYVASYFSSEGYYAVTNSYFETAVVNGPLRGLADGEDGGNGVYAYGSEPQFPHLSYMKSNYWVDVMFSTGPTHSQGQVDTAVHGEFFVNVRPNPSSTSFKLVYIGNDTTLNVRVIDVMGKVVENYQRISSASLLTIGERLSPGIYFAEVIQGDRRKVLKLVKTN